LTQILNNPSYRNAKNGATKKEAKNAKKPPKNGGFRLFFSFFPRVGKSKPKSSKHWKKLALFFQCLETFFPRVGKHRKYELPILVFFGSFLFYFVIRIMVLRILKEHLEDNCMHMEANVEILV